MYTYHIHLLTWLNRVVDNYENSFPDLSGHCSIITTRDRPLSYLLQITDETLQCYKPKILLVHDEVIYFKKMNIFKHNY